MERSGLYGLFVRVGREDWRRLLPREWAVGMQVPTSLVESLPRDHRLATGCRGTSAEFPVAQTYIKVALHTPCNACNACNARVISGCNGYSGRNGWGRETCVTDGVAVAAPRRGFRACASHPQACRRHLQGACATGASNLRSAPLACFWLYTGALERGLLS